jgi:hypothetical protein
MAAQMLSIVITVIKKVQTAKDPDQFAEVPLNLILPMGLSYIDAKDACLEFIGVIEEMSEKALKAEAERKAAAEAEEKPAEVVEPEVVNIQ